MVNYLVARIDAAAAGVVPLLAAAEEKGKSLFERLDPVSRTKVVMALLALVLVGLSLVVMTVVAGRYVRRIARQLPGRTPTHEDEWSRKPLVPKEPPQPTARDPE